MFTSWTNGMSKQQQIDFEASVRNAKPLILRIKELIEKDIETSRSDQLKKAYENNSWAYSQADSIGEQRALTKMLNKINNLLGE